MTNMTAIIASRRMRSPLAKKVLLQLSLLPAGAAGTVQPVRLKIADSLGTTPRMVLGTLDALVRDGLIHRTNPPGAYRLDTDAIEALPQL